MWMDNMRKSRRAAHRAKGMGPGITRAAVANLPPVHGTPLERLFAPAAEGRLR
jgi:hypothetical protein